jgi:hypothetical protein
VIYFETSKHDQMAKTQMPEDKKSFVTKFEKFLVNSQRMKKMKSMSSMKVQKTISVEKVDKMDDGLRNLNQKVQELQQMLTAKDQQLSHATTGLSQLENQIKVHKSAEAQLQ